MRKRDKVHHYSIHTTASGVVAKSWRGGTRRNGAPGFLCAICAKSPHEALERFSAYQPNHSEEIAAGA